MRKPSYWNKAKSILSKKDKVMKKLIYSYKDGSLVLRAKIDMSSPNINLRDPVLYRIRKVSHLRTAKKWCIYPLYDFTHGLSDALEGVTHSLCTLEFEDHRPLYNWILEEVSAPCLPRQIEFSRLNLHYSLLSKRKLIRLVEDGHVTGWDDPRMLTISGLRRRGYPASAIRLFCERIGISKSENNIDITVISQRILISEKREKLEENISKLLNIEAEKINIKGKTSDFMGLVGDKKASSCLVTILLEHA